MLGTPVVGAPPPPAPDDRTGAAAPGASEDVDDTDHGDGADEADGQDGEEGEEDDGTGPSDGTPARSRRVPLVFGLLVIGATVLLVATVVVIGLAGV
ncbi:hypothetical protein [Terrabacter carboxydivorans]|uniref:Uncharacterized protein n=1 Tax=Terrabacter carboxydivorans TaxID=619730 RepID=A0ABP5ZKA5_9MICO